jgi:hypothetical protein
VEVGIILRTVVHRVLFPRCRALLSPA